MALSDLSHRNAVFEAMREYRDLGRKDFLTRYGFGQNTYYVVPLDGWRYDAKALVGAAHGFQFPGQPLTSDEFSGGVRAGGPPLLAFIPGAFIGAAVFFGTSFDLAGPVLALVIGAGLGWLSGELGGRIQATVDGVGRGSTPAGSPATV